VLGQELESAANNKKCGYVIDIYVVCAVAPAPPRIQGQTLLWPFFVWPPRQYWRGFPESCEGRHLSENPGFCAYFTLCSALIRSKNASPRRLRPHYGVAAPAEGMGNRDSQSQQEFAKFWQPS
jgi:hypothetical protein